MQRIIIAVGAGVASAVLFSMPFKGTPVSLALAVAAPLPLMIAFLGFGQASALAGGLAGIAVIAYLLHPLIAAVFALWIVLPAAGLTYLALNRKTGAGVLAAAAAGIGVALSATVIAAAVWRYGSWTQAVAAAARDLQPVIGQLIGTSLPPGMTISGILRYEPVTMASWTALTLCLNLWGAGRLVHASNLLERPWPNVPDTLRLPRTLALILALALAGSFVKDALGVLSASIAAALAAVFALQGLGALHAMTRRWRSSVRGAILGAAYTLLVSLMFLPLLLAAALGLVDCFAQLPRRSFARSLEL